MYLDWKRPNIISKVDSLIGNRKDYLKFSYLIFESSRHQTIEPSNQVWRVVSAPMRSKGKVELLLCNERGLMKATRLDKDASVLNEDIDKAARGDLIACAVVQYIEKTDKFMILKKVGQLINPHIAMSDF